MLRILDEKENIFLLDCGEGTAHQLALISASNEEHERLYRSLNFIYISHMHADHHLGLCQVLQTWQQYTHSSATSEINQATLYLAGPTRLWSWLCEYASVQPGLLSSVVFLNNESMMPNTTSTSDVVQQAWTALGVDKMTNVYAKHCFQSFSIIIDHRTAGRLVYSGDTRPNAHLVKHGQRARLLIHEATFEDDLIEEAKEKRHSTIGEAMIVAKDMKADFILLTHFSQRYLDNAAVQVRSPPSPKQARKERFNTPPLAADDGLILSEDGTMTDTTHTSHSPTSKYQDGNHMTVPAVLASDLMQIKLSDFWKMPYYKKAISLAQEEMTIWDHPQEEIRLEEIK